MPSQLSVLSIAVVPPRPLHLLEVLEGPLCDVKSWVHLPQVGLSDEGQAADAQVRMKRVWMAVRPLREASHQSVLSGENETAVPFKVCVLEHI